MRLASLLLALVLLAAPGLAGAQESKKADLLVFAAASMKTALDEINGGWSSANGNNGGVKVSYAASSALARQIEAGAPADVFISADLDWMDYLDTKSLLKPGTRANLLANRIVLIAPADSKASAQITPALDLAGLLGKDGKLAMADVQSVPAGKYGKAALESLKLWPAVEARVAQAENVRAALNLVARGEAPLGIVYATDAAAEPKTRVLDAFPTNTHPPIVYPIALLKDSKHAMAASYLAFLRQPSAKAILEKNGFTVLAPDAKTN